MNFIKLVSRFISEHQILEFTEYISKSLEIKRIYSIGNIQQKPVQRRFNYFFGLD